MKNYVHIFMILSYVLFVSTTLAQQASILFVEDPAGWGVATHPDPLWHGVLTSIVGPDGFDWFGPTIAPYDDGPSLDSMQSYELVIWNNYDHYTDPTLTDNDQLNISSYISGGGRFWLIGQDAIHSGVDIFFFQSNFNLESVIEDYILGAPSTYIQGLAEAAGNSFHIYADYYDPLAGFFPDDLAPNADAHHIIKDTEWIHYPGILSNDSLTSFWAIDGRDPNPYSAWEQLVQDMLGVFLTGVAETATKIPVQKLQLHISPDPFVYSTTINYTIPRAEYVTLQIFDRTGRHIITLVDEFQTAGSYAVQWKGLDTNGVILPSGVYFCKLSGNTFLSTAKVVLLR